MVQYVGVATMPRAPVGESVYYADTTVSALLVGNSTVIFVLAGGGITLGLLTFVGLFYSGLALGMTAGVAANGLSSVAIGALVLPHGVFEFPGLWIAGAVGFRLPYQLFLYLQGARDRIITHDEAAESAVLVGIALCLIAAGAVVESTLTTEIAEQFVRS
jgi:uncharacterized membrane protein SpoIIM required for sporulation